MAFFYLIFGWQMFNTSYCSIFKTRQESHNALKNYSHNINKLSDSDTLEVISVATRKKRERIKLFWKATKKLKKEIQFTLIWNNEWRRNSARFVSKLHQARTSYFTQALIRYMSTTIDTYLRIKLQNYYQKFTHTWFWEIKVKGHQQIPFISTIKDSSFK